MTTLRDFEHAGWQAQAASYDAFAEATRLFVPALLEAAEVRAGVKLLDICCGPGVVSAEAVARGATVVGVDFSAAMLERARLACPQATFHEADAEQLPFPDACFDSAVANFGLHHVEWPARALAEARRVLKPGGRLAFTLWAERETNTAWRLISEAVATHGRRDVPMPAGNDADATPENFSRLTIAAGFDATSLICLRLEKPWRLPGDCDLVAIFEAGTVRMAALLAGQSPAALAAVRAHVTASLASYRRGSGIELPARAYLIVATTPGYRWQ